MSAAPGVCQAENCPKKGEALSPCGCVDGSHAVVPKEPGHEETEEAEGAVSEETESSEKAEE